MIQSVMMFMTIFSVGGDYYVLQKEISSHFWTGFNRGFPCFPPRNSSEMFRNKVWYNILCLNLLFFRFKRYKEVLNIPTPLLTQFWRHLDSVAGYFLNRFIYKQIPNIKTSIHPFNVSKIQHNVENNGG